MEVKVSLAETLKDWLSRKEMYSFSCSGFRRMAGVLLKDRFPSTDDIKGYAHIQLDSQQVIRGIKIFPFSILAARKMRDGHQGKARTRGKQTVPVTAEQRRPGGTSPPGSTHGTYCDSDGDGRIVRAAHGRNASGTTESLRPGPAMNLLIARR